MNAATAITERLETLAARGVAVTVSPTGALQVRPASLLTAEDREWFRARAAAVLAHLTAVPVPAISDSELWDGVVAVKLMGDADALVERSGVNGNHPVVKEAAAMVAGAFATRDLETLRLAVAEFAVVVRGVVSERFSVEKAGQSTAKQGSPSLPAQQPVPRPHSDATDCGRST